MIIWINENGREHSFLRACVFVRVCVSEDSVSQRLVRNVSCGVIIGLIC